MTGESKVPGTCVGVNPAVFILCDGVNFGVFAMLPFLLVTTEARTSAVASASLLGACMAAAQVSLSKRRETIV